MERRNGEKDKTKVRHSQPVRGRLCCLLGVEEEKVTIVFLFGVEDFEADRVGQGKSVRKIRGLNFETQLNNR
jgi:hypothetical protein